MAVTSREVEATAGQQTRAPRQEAINEVPMQGNVIATSSTNRQVERIGQNPADKQCCCHTQHNAGRSTPHIPRANIHAEQDGPGIGNSPFFQIPKDHLGYYNPRRECKIIRLLPDDDEICTEVVRDQCNSANEKHNTANVHEQCLCGG